MARFGPNDFSKGQKVRIYSKRSGQWGIFVTEGKVTNTRALKPVRGEKGLRQCLELDHIRHGMRMLPREFREGRLPRVGGPALFTGKNKYLYRGIVKVEVHDPGRGKYLSSLV